MDELKRFIWRKVLPLKLLVWFRDKKFSSLSKRDKRIREIFLPYAFRPGYDFYKFEMTENIASFIRELRVQEPCGYSWRAVASHVYDKFPELQNEINSGNQLDGRDLCDYAMKYYNESYEDGWN
jgi:hypothetical protein